MLLDADAKIYIQDNAGKTPLLWAVHAVFHSLMGKGANVNPGGSALISAIYNADTEMAIALINRGANVNPVTEDGWPPLMYAAMRGMQEVFERLMTARVDVNRKNRSGATALMQAAISGEAGMVASLLAAGADVNAADSTGMTALMWAIQRGNEAVFELLLEASPNVRIADSLMYATDSAQHHMVEALTAAEESRLPKAIPLEYALAAAPVEFVEGHPNEDIPVAELIQREEVFDVDEDPDPLSGADTSRILS